MHFFPAQDKQLFKHVLSALHNNLNIEIFHNDSSLIAE